MFIHSNIITPADITTSETPRGRFYNTPCGPLPSITTVLGSEVKPAIQNWRNALGEAEANRRTKRASDRGSAVHAMIENYLKNEQQDSSAYSHNDVAQFNSLRLHLNKINVVHAQEIPLWSESLGVAGRVDCIGEYNGIPAIIDFKTSNNPKTEAMIQDYFMQTTAYAIMVYEMYGIEISNVVILMAVENDLVPLVFKKQIYPYVEPLQERISKFYDKLLGTNK
jgi:genome maintenance exonuclease 1